MRRQVGFLATLEIYCSTWAGTTDAYKPWITILCIIVGPVLFGLSYVGALPGGDKVSFIHCMLFASIIVAVDPVAVSIYVLVILFQVVILLDL